MNFKAQFMRPDNTSWMVNKVDVVKMPPFARQRHQPRLAHYLMKQSYMIPRVAIDHFWLSKCWI